MSTEDEEPTFAQLLDWLEGRLSEEEATTVEEAVADGSEATKRTASWLRSFLQTSEQHLDAGPPAELRSRLNDIIHRDAATPRQPVRLAAALQFDSRSDPDPVGVRSGAGGSNDSYHLAYSTSGADILIDVTTQGVNHYRIDGQVLPSDGTETGPWLLSIEHPLGPWTDLRADELGCFAVPLVPADATTILLDNGEVEIEISLPDRRGTDR